MTLMYSATEFNFYNGLAFIMPMLLHDLVPISVELSGLVKSDQNGDRVSKNNKNWHIFSMKLKCF